MALHNLSISFLGFIYTPVQKLLTTLIKNRPFIKKSKHKYNCTVLKILLLFLFLWLAFHAMLSWRRLSRGSFADSFPLWCGHNKILCFMRATWAVDEKKAHSQSCVPLGRGTRGPLVSASVTCQNCKEICARKITFYLYTYISKVEYIYVER